MKVSTIRETKFIRISTVEGRRKATQIGLLTSFNHHATIRAIAERERGAGANKGIQRAELARVYALSRQGASTRRGLVMEDNRSQDLMGKPLDRRTFLKAVSLAAAAAAASGLLAACGGAASAPAAAPTNGGAAAGSTPAASSGGKAAPVDAAKDFSGTDDPVVFNSWIYEINFVKENVAR